MRRAEGFLKNLRSACCAEDLLVRSSTGEVMERIAKWPDFVSRAGQFLATAQPVDAMKRAGLLPDGEVAAALARGKPERSVPSELFSKLVATYGPPPAMRMFVGRARPFDPPP